MKKIKKKKNILVVDDEKQVCNIIRKILIHEGYNVFTALNGPEALNQLKKSVFDLMIVDLKMPVMDGLDVLKKALVIQSDLRAVLLTAYGTASVARDAASLGVFDFLSKPFDNQLLKKVVKENISAR